MSDYHDGDGYISMSPECGCPCEYVMGHLTQGAFNSVVAAHKNEEGDSIDTSRLKPVRHIYARWCFTEADMPFSRSLEEYDNPGQGRFKITVADYKRWDET